MLMCVRSPSDSISEYVRRLPSHGEMPFYSNESMLYGLPKSILKESSVLGEFMMGRFCYEFKDHPSIAAVAFIAWILRDYGICCDSDENTVGKFFLRNSVVFARCVSGRFLRSTYNF